MKLENLTAVLESFFFFFFFRYTIIVTLFVLEGSEKLFDNFVEISLVGCQHSTVIENGHNMNFNKEIIACL